MYVTKSDLFGSAQFQQGLKCEIPAAIFDEMLNILPPLAIAPDRFLFGLPDDCKEFTSGIVDGVKRYYCQIKRQLSFLSVGTAESWCLVVRDRDGKYRVSSMDHDLVPTSVYAGLSADTIGELNQAVRERYGARVASTLPLTA